MINIISTSISLDGPVSKGTLRGVEFIHLVNVLLMKFIPLHLLLLLLFEHLFLLLSQLRMILVELSLAFLLSRRHVNDNLIVIFETFRLYLLEGKFNQLLGHRQVFFFHQCLILQIELHVVNFVQGLLRSFTLPDIRDQVTNNIFHSLIPDVSFASEFLP